MEQLEVIQSKIYDIRGQKVMLDFDLAEMYGTETKYLKRSVKSNLKRFPSDFMFELTDSEWESFGGAKTGTSKRGGIRYMPYAFTELGVAMLSSVLNSDLAIEVNINIMRAFVARAPVVDLATSNPVHELQREVKELKEYIEEVFADYNDINDDTRMQLELINQTLAELQAQKALADKPRNPIGFITPKKK